VGQTIGDFGSWIQNPKPKAQNQKPKTHQNFLGVTELGYNRLVLFVGQKRGGFASNNGTVYPKLL
jgi:hypothetical protein